MKGLAILWAVCVTLALAFIWQNAAYRTARNAEQRIHRLESIARNLGYLPKVEPVEVKR